MSRREVVTLWITRKSVDAGMHPPEMVNAWDEYSIDEYVEGWLESCQQALAAVGSDLDQFRYITLRVDESVVHDAFFHTISADTQARVTDETGKS